MKNIFLGSLCFVGILAMILFWLITVKSPGLRELAMAVNIDLSYTTLEIIKIKALCDENEKMSESIINLMDENNLYDRNSNISHWPFSTPIFYRTLKYIAMNGNHSKDIYRSWIVKLKKENKSMKLARKNIEFSINYKKNQN